MDDGVYEMGDTNDPIQLAMIAAGLMVLMHRTGTTEFRFNIEGDEFVKNKPGGNGGMTLETDEGSGEIVIRMLDQKPRLKGESVQ